MPSAHQPFPPIDFKTRFPALDGIRALAVTLVFLDHYGGGGTHGGAILRILNAIRERGGYGVDLFFVLSGFLITGILYDTTHDSHFFQRFFARRSVRIFPIFYLLFAILAILTPLFHYHWQWRQLWFLVYMGNFPANADFSLYALPSPTHPAASAIIGHLWSLCVEEQFYLVWPLLVWLIRDRIKLLWTAGILSAAAFALRCVMVQVWPADLAERWLMRALPYRLDALLFGAMLALLLRGPNADRIQRAMPWVTLLAAIPTFLLFRTQSVSSHWMLTVGLTLIGLLSAGLIGWTLRAGSPAFRLFHLQPLRFLGKYSYGFYIWHVVWMPAWVAVLVILIRLTHSVALGGVLALVINFATTLAVSVLSYNLYEVRFLKWKRRFEYDSELRTHRTAFAPDGR